MGKTKFRIEKDGSIKLPEVVQQQSTLYTAKEAQKIVGCAKDFIPALTRAYKHRDPLFEPTVKASQGKPSKFSNSDLMKIAIMYHGRSLGLERWWLDIIDEALIFPLERRKKVLGQIFSHENEEFLDSMKKLVDAIGDAKRGSKNTNKSRSAEYIGNLSRSMIELAFTLANPFNLQTEVEYKAEIEVVVHLCGDLLVVETSFSPEKEKESTKLPTKVFEKYEKRQIKEKKMSQSDLESLLKEKIISVTFQVSKIREGLIKNLQEL